MMAEATFTKSTIREYFESLVITVILALFGTTFIVQAFKIPTPSMEDNLLVGDHLLVNKFAFGSRGSLADAVMPFKDVRRGDVIVFRYPKDPSKHYVKRVIGIPGDHLSLVDKQVFINKEALSEPYKVHKNVEGTYMDPSTNFFPPKPDQGIGGIEPFWYKEFLDDGTVVVPEGHYFAMGDNRDQSEDSRFWGFVPRELIVGKPLVVYWSYETDSDEYRRNGGWKESGRQIKDLFTNFFRKTRWARTFQVIR